MFEIVRPGTNINFIGGRKIAAIVSGVVVMLSILAYLGLARFGVDFAGGTEIHLQFVRVVEQDGEMVDVPVSKDEVDIGTVRKAVADIELSDDSVQSYGGDETAEFLVRVQHINFGASESFEQIKTILEAEYGADAFAEWVFDPEKDLKMTVVPAQRLDPLEVERLLIAGGALPPPRDGGVVASLAAADAGTADAGTEPAADAAAGDDDSAADADAQADTGDADSAAAASADAGTADAGTADAGTADAGTEPVVAPVAEVEEGAEAEWIVRDARYQNGLAITMPGIAKKVEELFATSTVLPADLTSRIVKVDSIGEKVGQQLRTQGMLAILVTLGLILIYIAFRFELSFAPGAVVALLHDVLVVVGVFSLGCVVFGFEFNLPIIGALMTIIGYSLNDTIVVYDRIRENVRRYKRKELSWIINTSINECLSRTLLTSATTFLVVLMMAIFGGPILRGFAVALLAGIVVGTYSSIYVASPAILALQRWLPVQQSKTT